MKAILHCLSSRLKIIECNIVVNNSIIVILEFIIVHIDLTVSPENDLELERDYRLGLAPGNPRIFSMKGLSFSEQQIAFILKSSDDGATVEGC